MRLLMKCGRLYRWRKEGGKSSLSPSLSRVSLHIFDIDIYTASMVGRRFDSFGNVFVLKIS